MFHPRTFALATPTSWMLFPFWYLVKWHLLTEAFPDHPPITLYPLYSDLFFFIAFTTT